MPSLSQRHCWLDAGGHASVAVQHDGAKEDQDSYAQRLLYLLVAQSVQEMDDQARRGFIVAKEPRNLRFETSPPPSLNCMQRLRAVISLAGP